MPKIIETEVFQIGELSEEAREAARSWYREGGFDYDWYAFVFEEFEQICDILGIRLRTRTARLMGGGTRQVPQIFFSGFWSQGDGACFEGRYAYAKGAALKLRKHAPLDDELHRIADALQAAQRRNFYQLYADVTHRGRYYHEYSMAISVGRDNALAQDICADGEEAVREALRDLACWLFSQLRGAYEYLSSDAVIDETIAANDYTFTVSGKRFG